MPATSRKNAKNTLPAVLMVLALAGCANNPEFAYKDGQCPTYPRETPVAIMCAIQTRLPCDPDAWQRPNYDRLWESAMAGQSDIPDAVTPDNQRAFASCISALTGKPVNPAWLAWDESQRKKAFRKAAAEHVPPQSTQQTVARYNLASQLFDQSQRMNTSEKIMTKAEECQQNLGLPRSPSTWTDQQKLENARCYEP